MTNHANIAAIASPLVSVVMPVYNAVAFLKAAIESVLAQSYPHFELLLINDGSTDGSLQVMQSFSDNRIHILNNDGNKGLIYSLNRGVAEAKGQYIARMDADDICLPQRFERQVAFLEVNRQVDLAAACINFINEHNEVTGDWPLDRQAITEKQVRHYMQRECCIAHPTVMAIASIMKQYPYTHNQKATEDYDLWLRLLTDGKVIGKIAEPLLLYRVHEQSVTQSDNKKKNVFFKIGHCKRRFLWSCIKRGKVNEFIIGVFIQMLANYIWGMGKQVKN